MLGFVYRKVLTYAKTRYHIDIFSLPNGPYHIVTFFTCRFYNFVILRIKKLTNNTE